MNFFNNIDIPFRLVLFYIFFAIFPLAILLVYGITFYTVVTVASIILLGSIFLFFLIKSFLDPIKEIENNLISNLEKEGNFSFLPSPEHSDETKDLFLNYNKFIKKMENYYKHMVGKTEISTITTKRKEKERRYYEFLYRATKIMLLANDTREIVKNIVDLSHELLPAEMILFELYHKTKNSFSIEEVANFTEKKNILGDVSIKYREIDYENSFAGYLMNKEDFISSREIAPEGKFEKFTEIASIIKIYELSVGSFIGIPLIFKDEFLGCLVFINPSEEDMVSGFKKGFLEELVKLFAYALKRQQLMDKYLVDLQTGLYTVYFFRQRLREELEFCRRVKSKSVVLVIAFDDDFSNSPHYLYAFGQQLAIIVKEESRFVDVATLLSPQKVAVLLPETSLRGGMIYASRILEKVEETKFVAQTSDIPPVKVTVSIGLVDLDKMAKEKLDVDTILQEAENAVKIAQTSGGNRIFAQ